MNEQNNHIGDVYGIYEIIEMLPNRDKEGRLNYKGKCSKCGYTKIGPLREFAAPSKIVNTCTHKRANGTPVIYGYKWNNKRIGRIFRGMMQRCYNINDKNYNTYGWNGIKICDEWINNPLLFEEWSLKNGYDNDLTIDRVCSDKDYCPDNCQWISLSENARKAGRVNWVTIGKETLTGRQWAQKLGLGILTIDKYIKKYGLGLTKMLIEKMIVDPPKNHKRKSNQTWFNVYEIDICNI